MQAQRARSRRITPQRNWPRSAACGEGLGANPQSAAGEVAQGPMQVTDYTAYARATWAGSSIDGCRDSAFQLTKRFRPPAFAA